MSFANAGFTQAEKALEWANKWHQTVVLWTIVGSIFAIVLGVLANMAGLPGFNFILATITLLAGIFFLTKPAIVLSVFGIGSLTSGLPGIKIGEIAKGNIPNFELKKFLGAGWDAIEATAHKVAHVFFFLTVLFVVLGTFPISDPALVLPALVVLTGFGFWSALFAKGNVWYRRITIAILLVSGSIIFFKMYDPKDKIERIEEAQEAYRAQLIDDALTPILRKAEHGVKLTADEGRILQKAKEREESRSLAKKAETFFRGRVIEYQVPSNIAPENLKPLCGIPPGEYEFTLGGNPFITIVRTWEEGDIIETYSLTKRGGFRTDLPLQYYPAFGVLLNGAPADSTIVVGSNGCAEVSFNMPGVLAKTFASGHQTVKPFSLHIVLR